jgi:hypothetical protein
MAFNNGGATHHMMVRDGGKSIAIPKTERLESLEKKLNLVAAAEGKSRSEVVCDALESYLPGRWQNIVAEYQK